MKRRNAEFKNTVRLQFLFLLLLICTIGVAVVLAGLYQLLSTPLVADPSILIPRARIGLSPEPGERFLFVALAFLVPITAYSLIIANLTLQPPRWALFWRLANWLLPFVIATVFLFPFIGFNFSQALLSGKPLPSEHQLELLAGCLTSAILWCGWLSYGTSSRLLGYTMSTGLAWVMFVVAMLLQITAWRVFSEASISVGVTWWNSMDAVIYPVSQVVAGKTLLADLPSQYGLFAEFLAPVFKVVGLSILKFTIICALLQLTSLCAVFFVAQKVIRDPALKCAIGVALVMVTYETCLWFIGIPELYFQYWPIRFFWPAISILAFYWYSHGQSIRRASIVSLVAAIGSLWNADTGLMIEISFAAFLIGKWVFFWLTQREVSGQQRRHLLLILIVHVSIFIFVVAAMLTYMAGKADCDLHFSWLYKYQMLFYGLGFMMIPMPLYPHPWMPVLAVYLVGMMTAVVSWGSAPMARRADLIFFLSLLGLGLFLYYQGRSHVLNLVTVCWPALLLAVILADRIVRLVHVGKLPRSQLCLPMVVMSLLIFCCFSFVKHIEKMWTSAISNYQTRGVAVNEIVSDELSFIRTYAIHGEECAILAKRQGLYYTAAGLASPISGPGYMEILTTQDRDAMLRQLAETRFNCVFIGLGEESEFDLGVDILPLLQGYASVQSTRGTMLFLHPITR